MFCVFLEPPRFSVQSQSLTAQKDQAVRLVCQPEGDQPIRVEWSLLNGTLLNELLLIRDSGENGPYPFE